MKNIIAIFQISDYLPIKSFFLAILLLANTGIISSQTIGYPITWTNTNPYDRACDHILKRAENGQLQFQASPNAGVYGVYFSDVKEVNNFDNLKYAFFISGTNVYIYKDGNFHSILSGLSNNETLTIKRTGSKMSWLRGNTEVHWTYTNANDRLYAHAKEFYGMPTIYASFEALNCLPNTVAADDIDMNWVHTKFFNGEGSDCSNIIAESRSYTDDLGRTIQSQARDINTGKVWASQAIFDEQGRAAITTMPAPTENPNIEYKEDFVLAEDGTAYGPQHFDTPSTLNNPTKIGEQAGTLGAWYSSQNTDQPEQATTDYPYSRTEFSSLTRFDRKSASPGNQHRMGSGHEISSYAMPAAGELHYLFGFRDDRCVIYEAADNGPALIGCDARPFYKIVKSINIDADGKESISFTDLEGNQVARCLSGQVDGQNVQTQYVSSALPSGEFVDIHVPDGCENGVQIDGMYQGYPPSSAKYDVYDLSNDELIIEDATTISINLPSAGFYRIVNKSMVDHSVLQELNYYNFTFNIYDDANRLIASVPPNGIDKNFVPALQLSHAGDDDQLSNFEDIGQTHYSNPLQATIPASISDINFVNLRFALDNNATYDLTGTAANQKSGVTYIPDNLYPEINKERKIANILENPELLQNLPISQILGDQRLIEAYVNKRIEDPTFFSGNALENLLYQNNTSSFGPDPEPECPNQPGSQPDGWHREGYVVDFDIFIDNNPTPAGSRTLSASKSVFADGTYEWSYDDNLYKGLYLGQLASGQSHLVELKVKNIQLVQTDVVFDLFQIGGNCYWWPVFLENGNPHSGDDLNSLFLHLEADINNINTAPQHSQLTQYRYNSLDQLIGQEEPDAGRTRYQYRKDGLPVFSQNAQQALDGKFAYIIYDKTGRITETGIYNSNANGFATPYVFDTRFNATNSTTRSILDSAESLDITRREERTFIAYDLAASDLPTGRYQQHLLGRVSKTWNESNTIWYSYKQSGQVEWLAQQPNGIPEIKFTDLDYDFQGNVAKIAYQEGQTDEFTHHFTYNDQRQLLLVETNTQNAVPKEQAKYEYYVDGTLKKTILAEGLQENDYVYTLQGWLKAINASDFDFNAPNDKLFSMSLEYFNGDYIPAGNNMAYLDTSNPQTSHSGQIMTQRWKTTAGDNAGHFAMNYGYNHRNELESSTFAIVDRVGIKWDLFPSNDYSVNNLTYDDNGNILSLHRDAYGNDREMDRFSYHYKSGTNQLDYLADASIGGTNFEDLQNQNSGNYTYDALGQLIEDASENMRIVYNRAGLVKEIRNRTTSQLEAEYFYGPDGKRVRKKQYIYPSPLSVPQVKDTWYLRNGASISGIYEEMTVNNIAEGIELKELPIYGVGRIGVAYKNNATAPDYHYELSDHLGNVRVTFRKHPTEPGALDVLSYSDYYPFGSKMPGRMSINNAYRFGYQGQFAEVDEETGWNSFELRSYDGRLGRWMTIDPAHQYFSPYLALSNNPVLHVDIRGDVDWPALAGGVLGVVSGGFEIAGGAAVGTTTGVTGVGAVAGGALIVDGVGRVGFGLAQIAVALKDDPRIKAPPSSFAGALGRGIDTALDTDGGFEVGLDVASGLATGGFGAAKNVNKLLNLDPLKKISLAEKADLGFRLYYSGIAITNNLIKFDKQFGGDGLPPGSIEIGPLIPATANGFEVIYNENGEPGYYDDNKVFNLLK